MKEILDTLKQALEELYSAARPQAGDTLVVGCSTSEIMGKRIGSAGNTNIARELSATLRTSAYVVKSSAVGVAFRARIRQAHPYRIPECPLSDRTTDEALSEFLDLGVVRFCSHVIRQFIQIVQGETIKRPPSRAGHDAQTVR